MTTKKDLHVIWGKLGGKGGKIDMMGGKGKMGGKSGTLKTKNNFSVLLNVSFASWISSLHIDLSLLE